MVKYPGWSVLGQPALRDCQRYEREYVDRLTQMLSRAVFMNREMATPGFRDAHWQSTRLGGVDSVGERMRVWSP